MTLVALLATLCVGCDEYPNIGGDREVTLTNVSDLCGLPGWVDGDVFEGWLRVIERSGEYDYEFFYGAAQEALLQWGGTYILEGNRTGPDSANGFAIDNCQVCSCNDRVKITLDVWEADAGIEGTLRFNVDRKDPDCDFFGSCQAIQRLAASPIADASR